MTHNLRDTEPTPAPKMPDWRDKLTAKAEPKQPAAEPEANQARDAERARQKRVIANMDGATATSALGIL